MLGSGELIVILCVVMLLFGGKKLPEFARSLGKGIREFKRACHDIDDGVDPLPPSDSASQDTTKVTSSNEPPPS